MKKLIDMEKALNQSEQTQKDLYKQLIAVELELFCLWLKDYEKVITSKERSISDVVNLYLKMK